MARLDWLGFYLTRNVSLVPYASFADMGLFAVLILGSEASVYHDDEEEHVVMTPAQLMSCTAFADIQGRALPLKGATR